MIDIIGVDMFAQISFKLSQKLLAGGPIFGALCRVWLDSIEIVTSDKQVAGETAAVFERIARGLGELKRFALAFGHLRCVDTRRRCRFFGLATGRLRYAAAIGLCARLLRDLFFRCFEWRFHIKRLSLRAKPRNLSISHQKKPEMSRLRST